MRPSSSARRRARKAMSVTPFTAESGILSAELTSLASGSKDHLADACSGAFKLSQRSISHFNGHPPKEVHFATAPHSFVLSRYSQRKNAPWTRFQWRPHSVQEAKS